MSKHALIVHGLGTNSQGNWFPWLRHKLEQLNFHIDVPDLPTPDNPVEHEWTQTIQELWKPENKPSPETTFRTIIGHSLGGTEVLRALELDWTQPLDLAVLVAATNNDGRRPQLANFFTTPFDWKKIARNCKKFILIFSDNDPFIKLETGPSFQNQLDAAGAPTELFMLHDAGHLMKRDGYEQFPMVLELIKKATSSQN